MDVNLNRSDAVDDLHRVVGGSSPKAKRNRKGSASPGQPVAGASQVSLTLPRELVATFDQVSRDTGINRAHLMREALSAYAGLLASGHRVYAMPGLRRVG